MKSISISRTYRYRIVSPGTPPPLLLVVVLVPPPPGLIETLSVSETVSETWGPESNRTVVVVIPRADGVGALRPGPKGLVVVDISILSIVLSHGAFLPVGCLSDAIQNTRSG